MANYINTLETQLKTRQVEAIALCERFHQMRQHLALAKFNEPAADGSRTDWIATADVLRWLRYLENGDHT